MKSELTEYFFNADVVKEYLTNIKNKKPSELPQIIIEIFLSDHPEFEGDGNSEKSKKCGFCLKIQFDDKYQSEYEALIESPDVEIKTLPIEYYSISWMSFAREDITPRSIPIKSALIDSSCQKFQNGSDIYISKIVKGLLDETDVVAVSQAHRQMKESFIGHDSIKNINQKIKNAVEVSDKTVEISVELASKNAWENSVITYVDEIPFHQIGKGEQCLIKTKLALAKISRTEPKTIKKNNLILLEEPENHLSYSKLNHLIDSVKEYCEQKDCTQSKQILISTHSSFVANKLGLESLILLGEKLVKLKDLKPDTCDFFKKLPGYNVLRLILCQRVILVEGDSDELIVQKAFKDKNQGKLPIHREIDVISVGTSFLRFLEIAEKIGIKVTVVTDNDGKIEALKKKYADYLETNAKPTIKICFDTEVDNRTSLNGKKFNYNTLEPNLLKENSLKLLNEVFEKKCSSEEELLQYMKENKTECALKVFETDKKVNFPKYILDAIQDDDKK